MRGGRADGRRVPGTLRAVVRGYRSGDVIYVNPVTTLMAAYRAAVERESAGRRLAYRELRIPLWMSQADLSDSDRWFDGDSFLAAARRAAGVGALIRQLLHDGAASRRFTHSPRRRSRQAVAGAERPAAGGVDPPAFAAAQPPLGAVPAGLLEGLAAVTLKECLPGRPWSPGR